MTAQEHCVKKGAETDSELWVENKENLLDRKEKGMAAGKAPNSHPMSLRLVSHHRYVFLHIYDSK